MRCPWCNAPDLDSELFECNTYRRCTEARGENCYYRADEFLRARVTKLEDAMRGLLHNMQQHRCDGCHIEKARKALANEVP